MHLCKKQNESKLQMVARPAHSKGTCPLPLVGSLHSWQLGRWHSSQARELPSEHFLPAYPPTPPPPGGVHVVP